MAREKDTYLNKEGLEYYHNKVKREFATKQELAQGLATKQNVLTSENAGEGIDISTDATGKVIISNTHTAPQWGSITGDIEDQTDLMEYLDDNIKKDVVIYGYPFNENDEPYQDTFEYPAHHYKYGIPSDPLDPSTITHLLSGEEMRTLINESNVYVLNYDTFTTKGFAPYSHWKDVDRDSWGLEIPPFGSSTASGYAIFESLECTHSINLTDAGGESLEVAVGTTTLATPINNPTITLSQNRGHQTASFTLNQASNQTIDLGRSGDWLELVAIPFDANGDMSIDGEASYWKLATRDFNILEPSFLTGQEVLEAINSANTFLTVVGQLDAFSGAFGKTFEFFTLSDYDKDVGKQELASRDSGLWATYVRSEDALCMTITLKDNRQWFAEAIGHLEFTRFDCGTSTVMIT